MSAAFLGQIVKAFRNNLAGSNAFAIDVQIMCAMSMQCQVSFLKYLNNINSSMKECCAKKLSYQKGNKVIKQAICGPILKGNFKRTLFIYIDTYS